MTMDPIQNPLFKEPVGTIFRGKREKLGMSIEDAAKNLKFGSHLVQAIEDEQWEKLGPAIFAKSYINSYIKLLGLNEAIKHEIPNLSSGTTALKTITQARVEPAGIQSKSILALVTLLGLTALGAFLYFRSPTVEMAPIDNSIPLAMAVPNAPVKPAAAAVPATVPAADSATVQTSLTEAAPATQAIVATEAVPQLLVRTKMETWLEIRGIDGAVLFRELIPAGQERTHSLEKVGKITLGHAGSAELLINGGVRDLTPFIKDDVARFTVDSSGNPAAISP
jgi:cytoskeleton protein RodZ